MIAQLTGIIESIGPQTVYLSVNGVTYEVMIPVAVMQSLEPTLKKDEKLTLITYHYYQTDPSKSIPILIGFANRVEKEFFEKFITVSGVGPKAAVKALNVSLSEIAQAIDEGDLAFMKSLPGVGEQRAKEIIAKLQGKMGKFSLIKGGERSSAAIVPTDLRDEALDVLIQLQYKKDEAKRMIEQAFLRKPGLRSVEEILSEVYKQKKVAAR